MQRGPSHFIGQETQRERETVTDVDFCYELDQILDQNNHDHNFVYCFLLQCCSRLAACKANRTQGEGQET